MIRTDARLTPLGLAAMLALLATMPVGAQEQVIIPAQPDIKTPLTVRDRDVPRPMVDFAGQANVAPQPRYFLDTIDQLNRIHRDETRTAPGLAKNNYIPQIFPIYNTEAIHIQTYLLRLLAFEGGMAEVMGADGITDASGRKVQYLFVVAPEFMMPGIIELVNMADRPGFIFYDATGKNFGAGPGAVQYIGKHRTASELRAILQGTELGNVGNFLFPPFADDSTNAIYIVDNPIDIADDLAALTLFDKPPLQVELDCTIYEIEDNDFGTLGVDWDAWKRHLTGNLTYISDSPTKFFDEAFNQYQVLLNLDARALAEFLNYTVTRGKAKILTATRVTMVNSEDNPGAVSGGQRGTATGTPAVIESIVTIPYTVLQEDVGPTNSSNARNEVRNDLFEGVRVTIQPFIGSESITLSITTVVNSRVGHAPETNIPLIATRRVDSIVNIKDGEPVVLGGLNRVNTLSTRTGIPGLRRIPGLRYLFSKAADDKHRCSHVLVSLTPRIKAAGAPEPAITTFKAAMGEVTPTMKLIPETMPPERRVEPAAQYKQSVEQVPTPPTVPPTIGVAPLGPIPAAPAPRPGAPTVTPKQAVEQVPVAPAAPQQVEVAPVPPERRGEK